MRDFAAFGGEGKWVLSIFRIALASRATYKTKFATPLASTR
jgi:hypothetical protein